MTPTLAQLAGMVLTWSAGVALGVRHRVAAGPAHASQTKWSEVAPLILVLQIAGGILLAHVLGQLLQILLEWIAERVFWRGMR